ncbi:CGNR zinc finger domain-containing protein [Nonomuraea recticatena]|uniref:CGNR zinc finger domain-containing protein n=1 Tax=Nonomuraea recticatena TaxID=46178 RepID=UPI003618B148
MDLRRGHRPGHGHRRGPGRQTPILRGGGCESVFFDTTRNASRRFCGLSCQNRAKASAYRARRAAETA